MDGTIYLGNQLFPYTKSFLTKVKDTGREYVYFTNNSSKNQSDYLDKLAHMGIPIEAEQMLISTHVMIDYLLTHHPGQSVYLVGTPALKQAFQEAGIEVKDEADIVVLGFDTSLTYDKLVKACQLIREGKTYYGINPDWNCPIEEGKFIPDCGSIAKLIEASTGKWPNFFGKPSHHTLNYFVNHLGLQEEQIAIVGDRLYTDIAVAQGTKVVSILVLSGETKLEDLEASMVKPDMVVQDLAELEGYL